MGGFSSVTGDEVIMYADNCSFDGTKRDGALDTNGQLWIGSTASPHVKKGNITAGSGISVTNSSGGIQVASTTPYGGPQTYVPVIDGQTGSPTVGYALQLGFYTVIGDRVFVDLVIALNSISGGSGNMLISLPLLSAAVYQAMGSCYVENATFTGNLSFRVPAALQYGQVMLATSGAGIATMQIAALSNSFVLSASVSYKYF